MMMRWRTSDSSPTTDEMRNQNDGNDIFQTIMSFLPPQDDHISDPDPSHIHNHNNNHIIDDECILSHITDDLIQIGTANNTECIIRKKEKRLTNSDSTTNMSRQNSSLLDNTHYIQNTIESSSPSFSSLLIKEWKPITTNILLEQPSSYPSSNSFDVLDHIFGSSFVQQLQLELETIMKIRSKLHHSRTTMERNLEEKLQLVSSQNDDHNNSPLLIRGDLSTFIPRSLHRSPAILQSSKSSVELANSNYKEQFCNPIMIDKYPYFHHFITSIESTILTHLSSSPLTKLKKRMIFNPSLTSIQFAIYPGDGVSGYRRHCDSGNLCSEYHNLEDNIHKNENNYAISQQQQDSADKDYSHSNNIKDHRIITAIYYLTPTDWDEELDGGQLRIHCHDSTISDTCIDQNDTSKFHRNETRHDVIPYSDRLVLFRSDIIEHEVLPSKRRERMAITIWFYGHFVDDDHDHDHDHDDDNNVHEKCLGCDTNLQNKSLNVTTKHADEVHEQVQKQSSSATSSNSTLNLICNLIHSVNQSSMDNVSSSLPSLPLPENLISSSSPSKEKKSIVLTNSTIFVSIPSYRDTEIHNTIHSLIQNALCPNRIFIGLVLQYDTSSSKLNEEVNKYHPFENKQFFIHSKIDENSSPWSSSKNLRTIILDHRFATGPCYARHLAQSLHRGEDYILQIDSHMRFRRNWDVYLLNQLQKCPNPSKTVLTTYPPGYIPIESAKGSMSKTVENNFFVPHNEIRGTVLVPWKFDSDGILRQKSRLLNDLINSSDSNDNIPCLLYAAGFNFSSSAVLFDCPYERHLHHLFFGEEISIAARLYTHGYDLYTVPQTVCYHLWDRSYRPTVQTDFGNNDSTTAKINTTTNNDGTNDEMKTQSSNQEALTRSREIMRKNSINHVKQQLLVNTNNIETLRRLGLGLDRNVVDFAKDLNVDFQNEIIYPGSENGQLDKSCFVTTS